MKIPETYYIYSLSDPNTGDVKYIGATNDVNSRFNIHIYDSKTNVTYKDRWISSLIKEGLKPILTVLDECPFYFYREKEAEQIVKHIKSGCVLFNKNSTDFMKTARINIELSIRHKGFINKVAFDNDIEIHEALCKIIDYYHNNHE